MILKERPWIFLPVRMPYQFNAIRNAVHGKIKGVPARVATVRDLVVLEFIASASRSSLGARRQDEADIVVLLQFNSSTVTAEDICYIGDRLLELCLTTKDRAQTVSQLKWLNDTLSQLNMSDRLYSLPADGENQGKAHVP